jgi:uncharacterized protein YbjT (DUF2867 family)
MPDHRIILVTGATGQQGGSLIRALAGSPFTIRAMTRRPDSEPGAALKASGVNVVPGDLDDAESLRAALRGVWGVFAVQNTLEAGVEREEEQGKRVAQLAKEAGVQHYVYTSVGSAHRRTGIPHFDNKARVEDTVRALRFTSHVIFRPVFFMENLLSPLFLNGDAIYSTLEPQTVLQMIAVDDIGRFVAQGFTHPERFNGREIDLAGDAATLPEAAAALSEGLGRTITYVRIPIEDVRKNSEDVALMLEWFDGVGYEADIHGIQREFGIRTTSLAEWARRRQTRP